jgi:hypothetical protein
VRGRGGAADGALRCVSAAQTLSALSASARADALPRCVAAAAGREEAVSLAGLGEAAVGAQLDKLLKAAAK